MHRLVMASICLAILSGCSSTQPSSTPQQVSASDIPYQKPADPPSAVVETVRIEPFTNRSTGLVAHVILCDIRNDGSEPVKTVFADISINYQQQSESCEYCIFSHLDNNNQPIQPGQVYREQGDEGFVTAMERVYGPVRSASVRVTRVE